MWTPIRRKMKLTLLAGLTFCIFLLMPLITQVIPKCYAQPYTLTITYDEYGWTSDMKKVGMTTPELGLTFRITIYNNSTKSFDSGSSNTLYIYVNVVKEGTSSSTIFSKVFSFDFSNELYLPPYESYAFFVRISSNSYSNLAIGSYTAELSYTQNEGGIGTHGTPIGLSPFNFKVETQESLNQAIQNSQTALINIGPIHITLFDFSVGVTVIPVVAVLAYILNKRRKK